MKYQDAIARLDGYRGQIAALRADMRRVQSEIEPQEIADYSFETANGPARLSDLFGKHDDLIVILNMGANCPYCTLWADGYNGVYPHLASRAAFVLASPDAPERQSKFAAARGWRFPMVSHRGSSFARDMGYTSDEGGFAPGICAFQRRSGKLYRVSNYSGAGPGDEFSPVYHLFDLLPEGTGDWSPAFKYPAQG